MHTRNMQYSLLQVMQDIDAWTGTLSDRHSKWVVPPDRRQTASQTWLGPSLYVYAHLFLQAPSVVESVPSAEHHRKGRVVIWDHGDGPKPQEGP
jgi:hypothetical protein